MLAEASVGKLLLTLSLPAMMSMAVHALYHIINTIFVGRWVGTIGIGAISVAFPIQMLLMAGGQSIGVGGASIISRRMGAGDSERAALTFGNMLLLSALLGFFFLIVGFAAMEPLLRLFGATDELLPMAVQYQQIMLISCPLATFCMVTNNTARAEGNAKMAMLALMSSAVVNIGLDFVLISLLGWGIRGAALATLVSVGVNALMMAVYFGRGRSEIAYGLRYLRLEKKIVREIVSVGSSAFAHGGAMSLTITLLNHVLRLYGGAVAIATFGVIFRMLTLIFMPMTGLTQGLQPIVGFNYGAGEFRRVKRAIKLAMVAAFALATAGFAVVMLFPDAIMKIFSEDPALVESGRNALRYTVLCLPLAGIQVVGAGLFMALGKSVQALALTLSRQVLVLIPLVLILPRFYGVNGVWLAFPISDATTFIVTTLFVSVLLRAIPDQIETRRGGR
jgi:putative MATE family efflux protein